MKQAIFSAMAVLLAMLTACSAKSTLPARGLSTTMASTTAMATESTSPSVTTEATSESIESAGATTVVSDIAETTATRSAAATSRVESTTTAQETTTMTQTSTGTTTTSVTNPTATTQTPTTVAATVPPQSFDVQVYVDYSKEYALSLGLLFMEGATVDNSGWNAPVNLYARLSDETMKNNICSRCDRLALEGFRYFGLQLRQLPDQSHQLYILYG